MAKNKAEVTGASAAPVLFTGALPCAFPDGEILFVVFLLPTPEQQMETQH